MSTDEQLLTEGLDAAGIVVAVFDACSGPCRH